MSRREAEMNTERQRARGLERTDNRGRRKKRGSEGLRASFSTADSARPPTPGRPTDRPSLLCHSPVVDLQDGEPRVLRQLFLLLL